MLLDFFKCCDCLVELRNRSAHSTLKKIDDEHGSVDRVDGATSAEPVDEADRWEQQQRVSPDDDDYPHEDPDNRFQGG